MSEQGVSAVPGPRVSRKIGAIAPSATLAVDAKAKALKAQGRPVIGFGAGEPDFPTPAAIVEAAVAACRDPANHHYTPTGGLPELREAIAAKTRRDSGLDVGGAAVLVTNGGKQAVANTFAALLDPGDEVLVPAPYWTTYPEAVALADGVTVDLPTDEASGFRVSVEQLEAAVTDRTKVLLFVSPSNPTGAVYPPELVAEIGRWAGERGLWVVTDEIYEHLVYGDARHTSMPVVAPELEDRWVVLNGVAKTYAMTGWRVGWMIGPPDVIGAATNLQSHTTSNVANVSQRAALAAVSGDLSAVAEMRAAFDRRRRTIHRMLNEIDGVSCAEPEGAFYAFPSFADVLGRDIKGRISQSTTELCEVVLDLAEVAMVPGEAFGATGYCRLSYALGDDDLVEGVSRIADLLGRRGVSTPARTVAPYGSWASPITPELTVTGAVWLGEVRVDGETTYWSELRPSEGGRVQLVRLERGGEPVDVLPDGFGARTRVHEYGGGAWLVRDGTVVFSNWEDQRLYRVRPETGEPPRPITSEPDSTAGLRYADGVVTPDGSWVVCVRERHPAAGADAAEGPSNEVVAVPVDGSAVEQPEAVAVLAGGRDFVAAPRVSRDGRMLAWLTWDHPAMPWDGTELWIARLVEPGDDGRGIGTAEPRRVAGGPDESLVQPEWGRHGQLYVVSDRDDWWNVYRVEDPDTLAPVTFVRAEIGQPAWVFGQSRYGFTADGTVVCTYTEGREAQLQLVSADGRDVRTTPLPYTSVASVQLSRDADGREEVTFVASSGFHEPVVARVELPAAAPAGAGAGAHDLQPEVLHRPRDLGLAPDLTALAEPITFPTLGPTGGGEAHAYYYPPTNPDVTAPDGELPPLLVLSHGGPTSAANPAYSLGVQFWTSRGFAVVDVDYGGSTGYGRTYRRRLDGRWGIVDVEDCVAAATWLVERGLADPDRLAIRGGSAGGFTTLAALTFTDTFRAGASHYGVADLAALATDTHKFESRYLDGLVGPWPDARDRYDERSPIHHTDRLSCPIILLQGLEDRIVPPRQAEMMVEALAAKGIPHAYLAFPGEQHGFRQAATIVRALTAELYFYGRVFGFEPAGEVEPVPIAFEERLEQGLLR